MKTYKLHLIRHGLTKGNLDGLYIGHTDMPLCPQGIEQIKKMKKDYTYPAADYVFSSPLKRCVSTAKLIYPNIKPIIIEDLIEYDFGQFEGRSAAELHEKQALFDQWLAGKPDVKPPFGESNEEFARRVCNCFVKIVDGIIKADADNTCIVTHGGVIMTIMANCALPEAMTHEWLTPSGCGYTLRITPSLWLSGRKLEAVEEIPIVPSEPRNYYDGWDYYPDDDDFDISEYI
ncbi:MAG: histidine phosphatase family protein [Clostridia bacterium]|nr:histidine phosphatase family protein [Clostridia bacterium]